MPFKHCSCGQISVCEGKCAECLKDALAELRSLKECPSCHGEKVRWYALYGMATCSECHGTGEKR